ncbi:MAG: sigma-70 family RNA polymerase sigma factor [Acidimicrobiales bacterium]|nr:sigma-70 family RNA polymerase sigma factor [Acidimicrobiales bacterium]
MTGRGFGRHSRPPRSTRGVLAGADLTSVALRAGRGDEDALTVLVERTIGDVRRYCAHMLGVGDADDLTQLTYLRAMRSLPSYRGDSTARTWLIGIARHVCLDELRSRQRRERLASRLQAERPAPPLVADTTSVEIREAIARLSPQRREAFVLTQLLGFGYEESAEIVGCPTGTIRSRVARARVDMIGDLSAVPDAATS